jgi:hypothetical protein
MPPVIERLQLTPNQTAQFKRLKDRLESNNKKRHDQLAEKLKPLLKEHFEAVQAELDSAQKTQFLDWFGDLTLFESLSTSDQHKDFILDVSQNQELGASGGTLTRRIGTINPDQPTSIRKDLEIDSLLYKALTMANFEKQLALSPDQTKQLDSRLHGNDVRLHKVHRRSERILAILKDEWEVPDWLDEILLKHQKTWLRQFEFQVYNMPYADSFGVLNPDVSEALELTPEQAKRIKELAQNYRTKIADLVRRTDQAIAQEEKEVRAKMMNLLKPEQMLQYRRWFGPDVINQ